MKFGDSRRNFGQNTTELPHFSLSLEAWRGFRELGAVWSELGAAHRRACRGQAIAMATP